MNKSVYDYKIGDDIPINSNLKGEIIDISDGHGQCFKIQLAQKDYSRKDLRTFWIDIEELEGFNEL